LTRVPASVARGRHTTGRLTNPYPGGLVLAHFPLNNEPAPGSNDNKASTTWLPDGVLRRESSTAAEHRQVDWPCYALPFMRAFISSIEYAGFF
jgi:hypothetical protein